MIKLCTEECLRLETGELGDAVLDPMIQNVSQASSMEIFSLRGPVLGSLIAIAIGSLC